jgi:hypothetical protein
MLTYEPDYTGKDADQTQAGQKIEKFRVVPGGDSQILCDRSNPGIRRRSIGLRDHYGDLGLADHRRCQCAERIPLAHGYLRPILSSLCLKQAFFVAVVNLELFRT